ncbi:hypothetical protein [Roseicella aerolata]|uniref:Uncharacterized protein n=1 Tax=Roseicella aerolata TaxID=2883479 RepID=A0A9X1ID85_9PROT|nr:hypothetical protein [Roseicella aerolata]MCB4821173.1 hypothetical protein [Roseicella aerolata]
MADPHIPTRTYREPHPHARPPQPDPLRGLDATAFFAERPNRRFLVAQAMTDDVARLHPLHRAEAEAYGALSIFENGAGLIGIALVDPERAEGLLTQAEEAAGDVFALLAHLERRGKIKLLAVPQTSKKGVR